MSAIVCFLPRVLPPIIIRYKAIKNAYVRLKRDGSVRISIPRWCAWDLALRQRLIDKARTMLQRSKGKVRAGCKTSHNQEQNTASQWHTAAQVMLWGKRVDKSSLPDKLDHHLREICRAEAGKWCEHYSEKLGLPYKQLRIKKTVSRWGSCSSLGNININMYLVHLEPRFLKYVVAHEISHLQEQNHSQAFWAVVERLYPDYRAVSRELKQVRIR